MPGVVVITHTDYRQFQTGGIVSHCREFLRHAPNPSTLQAVGVTIQPDEPVGRWQPYPLRPEASFLPVMRTSLERYNRRRLPFKLRVLVHLLPWLPSLLRDHRAVYTNDVEFAAPVLLLNRGCRVVMASHVGPGSALRLNSSRWFRHQLVRRAYQACEGWCVARADAVVLVSRESFDDFAERFPMSRAKLHHVANGVDLEFFKPAERGPARARLGLPPGAPVLLFVGRLEAQKDVALGLRAFARVRARHPDAVFVVAGEGSLRNELIGESDRLGIAEGVRFLGDVALADLPELYAAADLFLLTSAWEAMPMAVLEALACGRPVVSTAVGECVDLLREAGAGRVAGERDPEQLSEAVEAVLADPPQAGCCRERVSGFSAEAMAARLYRIIVGGTV